MAGHLELAFHGLSDIGLSRPNNEDVWIAKPDLGFYAVADGMGGHQAGEIAAKEAIEELALSVQIILSSAPKQTPDLVIALRAAIERANRKVFELGTTTRTLAGMGTTLCCLLCCSDAVIYAHVGDSRIYRYRSGKLTPLTRDHSLFARWLAMGRIAEECATPYPYKNVITRAVGTTRRANPEIAVASYSPGDLFFLCSDGLSDVLTENEIEKILERSENLTLSANRLIEKAKIKGSHDNITVLLVQYPQDEGTTNLPRQQRDDLARPASFESDARRVERPSLESF